MAPTPPHPIIIQGERESTILLRGVVGLLEDLQVTGKPKIIQTLDVSVPICVQTLGIGDESQCIRGNVIGDVRLHQGLLVCHGRVRPDLPERVEIGRLLAVVEVGRDLQAMLVTISRIDIRRRHPAIAEPHRVKILRSGTPLVVWSGGSVGDLSIQWFDGLVIG